MLEKIYTIPVNEAFDACREDHANGCPFCRLYDKLENDELELILGASMMEPDVRIKTNKDGFCHRHWEAMLIRKNRLGMALMLESHLNELREELAPGGLGEAFGPKGKKASARIEELEKSCYVCSRIENSLGHMLDNAALLWETESEFRTKLAEQPYFCLEHYRAFIEAARRNIFKRKFGDFYNAVSEVEMKYFDSLRADVSWFCKKFDYRYDAEPWGNAKDSIERSIKFLGGK